MNLRLPARAVAGAVVAAVTLGLAGCGDGCWGDAPKKPSSASTHAEPTTPPGASTASATPSASPDVPAAPSAPKERTMLKVGDPVPTVRVRDQHGRERSLEEFRGRRVVIWWFPKADTPGWTIEGCGFRDLHAEYTKKNVVLLGASYDTPAENLAFAQKQHYAFDILCDTERALGQALGLAADAKATYAKRWTYVIGPDGRIEQVIEKVAPRNHPAELLKTLP